ncbi:MAG: DEAD/DEAH box helicase [Bacteroidales bacterium]|jgi:ATP-dependent RNA helicase DeaD|nr:DEAD/DEAH box helicase [Bacteroidales bacterium]
MSNFENFGLKQDLLKAINDLGFENPTPIQAQVIPYMLSNEVSDLIGLAQTGTGKTAAFGLPVLQQINVDKLETQCLILAPTRELCVQISKDLLNYSKYIEKMKITSVYGGASIEPQIRELKKGTHIIVGTPGRVLDLLKRKLVKIEKIDFLVLDEADEMLNMGFKDDLDAILSKSAKTKKTLLFSATMPNEIRKIADNYMNSPKEISVGSKNSGAENVEHHYYVVSAKDRYLALKRIVDMYPAIYGIVFCRTRKETQEIAEKLIQDGYDADALHGDLSQVQRDHVMSKFRSQHLQVLVATDVAARGLDVNNLTHIINYNLPDENDIYIHRSGRTGRAGKSGISISIIHSKELSKIKNTEKILKKNIELKKIPDGKEICKIQLMSMIDKINNVETIDNQIDTFLPLIYQKLNWLSREDLITRFVSVEFNRFLMYYSNTRDINFDVNERRDERRMGERDKGRKGERANGRRDERKTKNGERTNGRRDERSNSKGKIRLSKYFLSLGEKDGFSKYKLLEIINNSDGLAGVEVGKIEILKTHTFFEIDSNFHENAMKIFKNRRYDGKRLKIEKK